jgi:hypothetical protein
VREELEELISQLTDGRAIGGSESKGAEVDNVVDTSGEAVRAVAAPEASIRIEPETGGVVVVEGTAADESVGASGVELDASAEHLVEGGMGSFDAGNGAEAERGRGDEVVRSGREDRFLLGAQKGEKGASQGGVDAGDRGVVDDAISRAGGMDGGGDGTDAGGFEFAAILHCGRQWFVCDEKQVIAAWGLLDEGTHSSAEGGAPGAEGGFIVPIGDEETCQVAEEDTEVGVGIEEPLASDCRVRDAGPMRAKAGLEVLGARLEGNEMDAEA